MIMHLVMVCDIVLLNIVLFCFPLEFLKAEDWNWENKRLFLLICNVALLASEWCFHTIIHQRMVTAIDILKRICYLVLMQSLVAYVLMRHLMYQTGAGWLLTYTALAYLAVLIVARFLERNALKHFRRNGHNIRTVTMVGLESELCRIYEQLEETPTAGYRIHGYYSNETVSDSRIPWLGTIEGLISDIKQGKKVELCDELYVCLSRKDRETIELLAQYADSQLTRFFYVPKSLEVIQLSLKREFINGIEVFATHESPLDNILARFIKRVLDIIISSLALILTGILFPIIVCIIKKQSPGPIFFMQQRTGLDGKNFFCYKFRSMHVNKDADKLQATKDDPRKYPFGDFMRKASIDELPQFWNVLKGDMSVVGPRPHMLAHTELYSHKIREYMVRHFVKPGITGWAQVTGYRGETKELWQMKERVTRDIWYIENWNFWLDLRIIWLTFRTCFSHDENAY